MLSAMRLALVGISVAILAIGCRQSTAPVVDVTMSLQANTTVVQRGDTVTFTVNATGNNLFGVVMEYGDDGTDQFATGGALNARVTFKHAYSAAGTFTARAIVTDAIIGEKEATVAIVVN